MPDTATNEGGGGCTQTSVGNTIGDSVFYDKLRLLRCKSAKSAWHGQTTETSARARGLCQTLLGMVALYKFETCSMHRSAGNDTYGHISGFLGTLASTIHVCRSASPHALCNTGFC